MAIHLLREPFPYCPTFLLFEQLPKLLILQRLIPKGSSCKMAELESAWARLNAKWIQSDQASDIDAGNFWSVQYFTQ